MTHKKLIITEKPSVAQDYAKVFQVSGRNNGYIENQDYVITWCVGHLVEMVYPEEYDIRYKRWVLADLPFLPQTYKYGVIKNVQQQYDIVHKLLHRQDIDTVYWAGDSGKEGQTIEENIRNYGGFADKSIPEIVLSGLESKNLEKYLTLSEEKSQLEKRKKEIEAEQRAISVPFVEQLGQGCKAVLEDGTNRYRITYNPTRRTSVGKDQMEKLKKL